MSTNERSSNTDTQLQRISQLSGGDRGMQVNNLMRFYNEESLTACFHALDRKKAVGPDGRTKDDYGVKLDENIGDLVARMKRMAYRPGPVRQVLIPKEGKPGTFRPLGISDIEDKVVQKMTKKILESIYEPLFLNCSYGFRPGRGAHDALRDLHDFLFRNDIQTVIDVDLAAYFDTIDHRILEELLQEKITDFTFMRYISRMFKAGVLAEGELSISEEGVPQGSSCSPVLANVMAHHVIDVWFEETVKSHVRGKVALFRYADDLVICCQYDADAERVKAALGKRLTKFKLRMNEDKTKLIRFSKKAQGRGAKQGTFDYLGFTFFLGKSPRGFVVPKLKTSSKRIRAKLKRVNTWAKSVRCHYRMPALWKTFCRKMMGHINYYGVTDNVTAVQDFVCSATRILYKWLNRRSQRRSFNWEQFNRFMAANPRPRICVKVALY